MTAPALARRRRQRVRHVGVPRAGGMSTGRATLRRHSVTLRRRAPLAALAVTGLVVHAGLAPHLAIGGLAPDVLLVAVVAVAAGRGERAGAGFGFATGLGADLFLATPLGTSALAYTLLGHALGGRDDLSGRMGLSFLGVAAGQLMTAVTATALGGVPFPDTAALLRIVGVAAMSAPLGPPTAVLVRLLARPGGARR